MRLGNTTIASARLGNNAVQAVYLGNNLVWQNAPVATAATGIGQTSFTANWNAYTGALYYLLDVSTSSTFATFVYQNEPVYAPTTSYVVIGLQSNTTYYYRVRASDGFDSDAQAFFDRVSAATGTLSNTEKTAVNQLVLGMKSGVSPIWTKMKAVYPMVGASAAACAQNLKSSSFTGSFTSGWTFANTGVTPNGTSAFMNTFLQPNVVMNFNSQSYFIYKTTVQSGDACEFGTNDFTASGINLFLNSGYNTINEFVLAGTFTSTTIAGAYILNRNNSNDKKLFRNGSLFQTITSAASNFESGLIYLGARSTLLGVGQFFTNTQTRFFSIGDGLTDTQASNFYTAVQLFNQTLNRNVGPQIVSDADAQAYINRVYTAGGTLTNTEANAVNQLTIDMKAAGIWTAMKAVYPMVGASAAACAQNLKSSSFTGTFTAGWTFASTGVTPNGSSAFFNTGFAPSANLSQDSSHVSFYSRTTDASSTSSIEIGSLTTSPISYFHSHIFYLGAQYFMLLGRDGSSAVSNSSSLGFFNGNRKNATTISHFKNGANLGDLTATSVALNALNVFIGAGNINGSASNFSNRQCAFASIGDGLGDTQAGLFNTVVNSFQTTLSRNV
jgi:hypothetical protein